MTTTMTCPKCHGRGSYMDMGYMTISCRECNSQGVVMIEEAAAEKLATKKRRASKRKPTQQQERVAEVKSEPAPSVVAEQKPAPVGEAA